jgi:hypothetical protein
MRHRPSQSIPVRRKPAFLRPIPLPHAIVLAAPGFERPARAKARTSLLPMARTAGTPQ